MPGPELKRSSFRVATTPSAHPDQSLCTAPKICKIRLSIMAEIDVSDFNYISTIYSLLISRPLEFPLIVARCQKP